MSRHGLTACPARMQPQASQEWEAVSPGPSLPEGHFLYTAVAQTLVPIRITRGALENSNAKAEHKANYIRYAVGGIRIAVHQDF